MSLVSWRARALTAAGAGVATLIGTIILWRTGWPGGAVLAAFFVSSSVVSRLAPAPPASDAKEDRRDHWQVLANGAPAAIAALLTDGSSTLGLWIVTGSLAAAAADTWATSIGATSPAPPRLLLDWREVPAGTSGGVTGRGSLGGAAGALVVAATGALTGGGLRLLVAATLIGFAGMLADSALGASVQGQFSCPRCECPSEWAVHHCGTKTRRTGGVGWIDNDAVNLAATSLAAALAAGWWRWVP